MQSTSVRLTSEFYDGTPIEVAQKLIGKLMCRKFDDGTILKLRIIETEAYTAPDDLANRSTKWTPEKIKASLLPKGSLYIYICYGIHMMVNVIVGQPDRHEGVLFRAIETAFGPGKVGSKLEVKKDMHGIDLSTSDIIWLEDDGVKWDYISTPRIGINYAPEPWLSKPWRFYHETPESKKYASKLSHSKPKKKKE